MGLTNANLTLLRYIQEKQKISLNELAEKFSKNSTSIRREIELINLYSRNPLIEIKNGKCITKISYSDYAKFVQTITLHEYKSTTQERINSFIVISFFNSYVNASKLYESWGLSITTKKQDMAHLRKYLDQFHLSLVSLHKKGLYIAGDELQFRFLVIQIMYPLFDLNANQNITARITNTPFENLNYSFLSSFTPYLDKAFKIQNNFLQNYNLSITNASEKFLLLFSCMLEIKTIENYKFNLITLPLSPLNLYVCDNSHYNKIYNVVLSFLDFSLNLDFPFDQKLQTTTTIFVEKIEECLTSHIYTHEALISECYCYFYKHIMLNHFHLKIVDKLVKNTQEHLPVLYQIIQKYSDIFEKAYHLNFFDDQYSTLTFIFQKSINRNRIINANNFKDKKRVIIVTNSSYERISYFMSQVKEYVEVSFVSMITLNELYLLDTLSYDYLFSLSERIYNILKKQNYKVIKLSYFIDNQDIETLILYGFSRIKTKFLTKEFVDEIKEMDKSEICDYLKNYYNDYFI